MLIETNCFIFERDRSLLMEIQNSQAAIEIWAYGLETPHGMGTSAYAFAIRQEGRWYEVYQRLVMLDDEEYARIHIKKHLSECATEFPFSPHERVYQSAKREKEVDWTKITTIDPPFSIFLFRDKLRTSSEKQNGERVFRKKLADVAFAFETPSSSTIFQVTNNPYWMKICYTEEELAGMEEVWYYHIDDEKEIAEFQRTGSEEYFHCQRVEQFSRIKIKLSDCIQ